MQIKNYYVIIFIVSLFLSCQNSKQENINTLRPMEDKLVNVLLTLYKSGNDNNISDETNFMLKELILKQVPEKNWLTKEYQDALAKILKGYVNESLRNYLLSNNFSENVLKKENQTTGKEYASFANAYYSLKALLLELEKEKLNNYGVKSLIYIEQLIGMLFFPDTDQPRSYETERSRFENQKKLLEKSQIDEQIIINFFNGNPIINEKILREKYKKSSG